MAYLYSQNFTRARGLVADNGSQGDHLLDNKGAECPGDTVTPRKKRKGDDGKVQLQVKTTSTQPRAGLREPAEGAEMSPPRSRKRALPPAPDKPVMCAVCPNLTNTCFMSAGLAFAGAAITPSFLGELERRGLPSRHRNIGVPQHNIWNGLRSDQRLPQTRVRAWKAVRDSFCILIRALNYPHGKASANEAQFRELIINLHRYAQLCDDKQLLAMLPLELDHNNTMTEQQFNEACTRLSQGDAEEFLSAVLDLLDVNDPAACSQMSKTFKNSSCWKVATIERAGWVTDVEHYEEYPPEPGLWLGVNLDRQQSPTVNSFSQGLECTMHGYEGQDSEPLCREKAAGALEQKLEQLKSDEGKHEIPDEKARKAIIAGVHQHLGKIGSWDDNAALECRRGISVDMAKKLNPTFMTRLNADCDVELPFSQSLKVIPTQRLKEFASVPENMKLRKDDYIQERMLYEHDASQQPPHDLRRYIMTTLGDGSTPLNRMSIDLINISRSLYQCARVPVANTVLLRNSAGQVTVASEYLNDYVARGLAKFKFNYTAGAGADALQQNAVGAEAVVMDAFLNNVDVDQSRLALTNLPGRRTEQIPTVFRTDYYCLGLQRNNGISALEDPLVLFHELIKSPCFRNLSERAIKLGMLQLASISDDMIKAVVTNHWSGLAEDRDSMISELIRRRDLLLALGEQQYELSAAEYQQVRQNFYGVNHSACVAAVCDSQGEIDLPNVRVDGLAVPCTGRLRAALCHKGFVAGSGHYINLRCYRDKDNKENWFVQDDQLREGDALLGGVPISEYLRLNNLQDRIDKANPDGFGSLQNLLTVRPMALTPSLLLWQLNDGVNELGKEDKTLLAEWRRQAQKVEAYQTALARSLEETSQKQASQKQAGQKQTSQEQQQAAASNLYGDVTIRRRRGGLV